MPYPLCFVFFPYTTLFRSRRCIGTNHHRADRKNYRGNPCPPAKTPQKTKPLLKRASTDGVPVPAPHSNCCWRTPIGRLSAHRDRKSTRLNSSHVKISYAVF